MKISQESLKPIYVQIAEGIEEDILCQILKEDDQAYSSYQISSEYGVNPATAAKGIGILTIEGVLYKKRGLGVFVSKGAKEKILEKRKNQFKKEMIPEFLTEAKKLGISIDELKDMLENITRKG